MAAVNNERSKTTAQSVILEKPVGGIPAGESVISIPDAAERMGVVVTKVMDLLRNGQILAVRVNNVRYICLLYTSDAADEVRRV